MSTTIFTTAILATGVTKFTWQDAHGCGDGLLVDADTALSQWRDMADILVCSASVGPSTRAERTTGPHALLAEIVRTAAGSLDVNLYLTAAPPTALPANSQRLDHTQVTVGSAALLALLLEHYRELVVRATAVRPDRRTTSPLLRGARFAE